MSATEPSEADTDQDEAAAPGNETAPPDDAAASKGSVDDPWANQERQGQRRSML